MTSIETVALGGLISINKHPRARLAEDSQLPCGGGVQQTFSDAPCLATGRWRLRRPWGGECEHTYCSACAAKRLAADERLWNYITKGRLL